MIVYHGSFLEILQPDVQHSRKAVDFGRGFYITPLYEQAKKWAARYKRQGKNAVVSKYAFDDCSLTEVKTIIFESYTEEWLDFILQCRLEKDSSDYEIVIGGVANDKVFNTIELFIDGLINKVDAIGRLKYEKPNLQICIRTQTVIDKYLVFLGSEYL